MGEWDGEEFEFPTLKIPYLVVLLMIDKETVLIRVFRGFLKKSASMKVIHEIASINDLDNAFKRIGMELKLRK